MSVERMSVRTWFTSLPPAVRLAFLILAAGLLSAVAFTIVMSLFQMFGGTFNATDLLKRLAFACIFAAPVAMRHWAVWVGSVALCIYLTVPTVNAVVKMGQFFAWHHNALMAGSYPLLFGLSVLFAWLLSRSLLERKTSG